jgi:hypothetical protein
VYAPGLRPLGRVSAYPSAWRQAPNNGRKPGVLRRLSLQRRCNGPVMVDATGKDRCFPGDSVDVTGIEPATRRSDPYDARMANLAKARRSPRYHRPRPWRSDDESEMILRFAFQWMTCRDRSGPSARSWARQLGVSHTWLQKLVKRLKIDMELQQEVRRCGDPTLAQLAYARERTREMRMRGELRPSRFRRTTRA